MSTLRVSWLAVFMCLSLAYFAGVPAQAQNKPKGPNPKPRAIAQAVPTQAKAGRPGKKVKNAVANAPLIAALEETNAILHKADHDYKGHRIKAANHIHHAIRKLGAAEPKKDFRDPPGKLQQKESDALLQGALMRLQKILPAINNSAAGNRQAAAAAVQSAITELQTALKIR